MGLRQQLDDDIKAAMLSHDAHRVETLRGLKTVILYADVATKTRDTGGVDEDAIEALLFKEAKKRQESADLYVKGGSQERADKELAEKAMIEAYLPMQMSEPELSEIIETVIAELMPEGTLNMGNVIGVVKAKVGSSADGGTIARLVREKLAK